MCPWLSPWGPFSLAMVKWLLVGWRAFRTTERAPSSGVFSLMTRETRAMRRLLLSSALLIAMASAAVAQSSGAVPGATQSSIIGGNGAVLNALTAPNARVTGACAADNSCATFPLTPLGAANPSLAPRLTPTIGAQPNQSGSALTAPPLVATPNPTGALNPGSALASPGAGTTPSQIGGLNQSRSAGTNTPSTLQSSGIAGTPATHAPSMPSSAFQSQCANSTGCSAFQAQ